MARYWGLKGNRLRAAIWVQSLVAVAIFGYSSAGTGGVLNMPAFRQQFPQIDVTDSVGQERHDKSTIQGTVLAIYTLLGTFGSLACTFLGDVLGRRMTIFIAAGVELIGALLMATSYSFAQFIVARIFLGLGVGGIIATVSAWQSELSKAESRGSHVSSFGIYCGVGLSTALWISFGFSFTSGSVSWRFPLSFGGILAIVVMVFIFTLPESPRWLKMKGRHDEARHILELLHPGEQEVVDKELEDIDLALKMSANHATLSSLFKMGPQRIFHRVVLACVVQIMLQMTGVNVVAFYAGSIYAEFLKFPPVEANALAAASQACIILGGIICFFTVERFGRRQLMLVSATGMCLCLVVLTGLLSRPDNAAGLKAAVFFLFLYYVVYTLGFIGIPFLYASEIAPVQLRAAVCGLSTAVSWLFNFLVVEITPVGFADIGYRYFIIYAVCCAAFVPIIYFFYPETAGRSLEEIDAIFAESKSVFDTVQVARRMPRLHLAELGYKKQINDSMHIEIKEEGA